MAEAYWEMEWTLQQQVFDLRLACFSRRVVSWSRLPIPSTGARGAARP